MKTNKFFDIAMKQAAGLAGNKRRLLLVITQLGLKLRDVQWKNLKAADAKDKLLITARLAKAYAKGDYREIPWKSLLMITGAILYFVMPVDLIPDVVPVLGFTDDFGIVMAIYHSLESDISNFLDWEKKQVVPS